MWPKFNLFTRGFSNVLLLILSYFVGSNRPLHTDPGPTLSKCRGPGFSRFESDTWADSYKPLSLRHLQNKCRNCRNCRPILFVMF